MHVWYVKGLPIPFYVNRSKRTFLKRRWAHCLTHWSHKVIKNINYNFSSWILQLNKTTNLCSFYCYLNTWHNTLYLASRYPSKTYCSPCSYKNFHNARTVFLVQGRHAISESTKCWRVTRWLAKFCVGYSQFNQSASC